MQKADEWDIVPQNHFIIYTKIKDESNSNHHWLSKDRA